MSFIVYSSAKGGAGKTTAAVLAACELALAGVTVIDADPNRNVLDWALLGDLPETLTVIGDSCEETIIASIEKAAEKSQFVVIDLEVTANLMVSYAISSTVK